MTHDDVRRLSPVHDAGRLRQAIYDNLTARAVYRGQIVMPCIPAPRDHYVGQLRAFFRELGKPLKEAEVERLRELIGCTLADQFPSAAGSKLVVQYEMTASPTLQKNLACSASITHPSVADQYRGWTASRGEHSFGRFPDARLLALVDQLSVPPSETPLLDIGAGTGRNTLPLARRTIPVDALELTPAFAESLHSAAAAERLPVRVIQGDILDRQVELPASRYRLAVASEVVPHFLDAAALRRLLERMSECVAAGGHFLMNLFLTDDDYEPSPLVRQMSHVAWSSLFTRDELRVAMADLPFEWIADDSVLQYEQAHLPPEAWPPTAWFTTWASGRAVTPLADAFPPFELRWVVLRRT